MATTFAPPTQIPQTTPGQQPDALDPLTSQPPAAEVLLNADTTELAELELFVQALEELKNGSAIVSLEYLGSEENERGTLHRYGFVTADGYAYGGHAGIPRHQTSDIAALSTAAWGTSPRGHNEHTALDLMEDGIPTFFIGNEGSYRPPERPEPQKAMSLAGTAAAALSFAREMADTDFKYLVHPSWRTAVGDSKAGMEGMGIVSFADYFGQQVLMADYTAACMPRKMKPSDLVEFAHQLREEPLEAARLAGRLAIGLILHYPSTIDPHPYAVTQQIAKAPAVLSGEAGELGKLVGKNKMLHQTGFKKDTWSMIQEWQNIFAHHPNVRITPLEGSHLTIADPVTLAYVRSRQRAFRELFTTHDNKLVGDDGEELFSGDDVWNLAHTYVDQYLHALPQDPVHKALRWLFRTHNRLAEAA